MQRIVLWIGLAVALLLFLGVGAAQAQVPNPPTNLTATAGVMQVSLSWQAPGGGGPVGQYHVLRGTADGGPYTQIGTTDSVTLTYTDTNGLAAGTTYYYVVRSWNGMAGESGNSNQASATPTAGGGGGVEPPTNLTATGGAMAISLSWTASPTQGVTQYRVLRGDATGGPYTQIGTTDAATTTYQDTNNLTPGTTYYYVVRAWNGTTESGNSNEASAFPTMGGGIQPPTTLTATAGNTLVDLSWTASPSPGVTQYRVLRSETDGGPYTQIGTTAAPGTTYQDTGLTNGTTYYYVARAWDGTTESTNSNQASATPTGGGGGIQPPTGLTATGQMGSIALSWTASGSPGVTEYRVLRSDAMGGPYTQIGTATAPTTTYTDNNVNPGTTYYYVARAWDGNQESANSNEASAWATMGGGGVQPPTGLTATGQMGSIALSWTASGSPGVTEYRVLRSDATGGPYTQIGTATAPTTTYTDNNVNPGTTYYYVARTWDGNQESANSNEASAWATMGGGGVQPPSGLTATAGNTVVDLSWTASPSGGVTQYRVLRGDATGGPYTQVGTTAAPGTTYQDTGLTNGMTYYYVVRAWDGAAESGNSNEASATPAVPTPPEPPTNLAATGGNTVVDLSWTASTSQGVTQYRVLRAEATGGPYTQVGTAAGTSYQDTGLTNGTAYYYVARAWNGTLESANSNEATATPTAPPAAPTDLTATPGDGLIDLSWTASATEGVTETRVLRSETTGGPYTQIGTTAAPGTTYQDTGRINGKTYYYVVRAFKGGQESGNSNEASAAPNGPPAAPTNLTATPDSTVVDLSWTASVSPNVAQYRVLRGAATGGPYTQVGTVEGTTFHDTGLTNGTTYYYVVRAWNGALESANSNEASVIPAEGPPAAPTNLTATGANQAINVSWQASVTQGISEYRVLRSQTEGGPYILLATVSPTQTTYHNAGLTNGTTYWYVVRAVKNGMESANSNEAAATPNAPIWVESIRPGFGADGTPQPIVRFRWHAATSHPHTYQDHPEWNHSDNPIGAPTHTITVYDITSNQTVIGSAPDPDDFVDVQMTNGNRVSVTVAWQCHGQYWDDQLQQMVWCQAHPHSVSATVDVSQIDATEHQAVDSRKDPRDKSRYLDYQFGSRTYLGGLFVGYNADGARVGRSYLKFPLGGIVGTGNVQIAQVCCWFTQGAQAGTNSIRLDYCPDNSWSENSIVWTTAPATAPIAGPAREVTYDPQTTTPHWEGWTVTNDIYHLLEANATTISQVLRADNETTVGWMYFAKRQFETRKQPMLLVVRDVAQ